MFEVTALDYWMDKDSENDDIKLRECPRCKTPVRISYRYADIVKEKLAEVEEVKKRLNEEEKQFQYFQNKLKKKMSRLVRHYPDIERRKILSDLSGPHEEQESDVKSVSTHQMLSNWLDQRKTMAELNTIKNQLRLLKQIYKVREKVKTDLQVKKDLPSLNQPTLEQKYDQGAKEVNKKLNLLENDLIKLQISPQSLTDIRDEVICVGLLLKIRVVQCEIERRSVSLAFDEEDWLERQGKQLNAGERLSQAEAGAIEAKINRIRKECDLEGLTPEERVMIVKAMNFSQGHWYKCRKGHIYAIGECGGAMEERKCPECDDTIGGTNHRLVEGNEVT